MKRPQILVPPPAVLKNGEPDPQGMDRYFNWMADRGVDGLFINDVSRFGSHRPICFLL